MFTTLDQSLAGRKRRGLTFICGVLTQVFVMSLAIFLGLVFPDELPLTRRYTPVWLADLKPPERPALKPPPRPVVRIVAPTLKPPEPKAPAMILPPEPAPVREARLDPPRVEPNITPARPVPVPAAPVQPTPPPKKRVEVRTGLFGGGAPEPVTTHRPVEQVQTGGFGSPQGLPGRAQGDSAGNVPKLGAFGLPEGPGVGNGTGGAHGVQGVVASAGFGSGVAGGGYEHASGAAQPQVAMGGFERAPAAARPSKALTPAPESVNFQPVEILSKPSPVYTEEARRSGVQGEVALSVVFQASGTIRVVGVVKSLGHGLDQAAQQAAAQIRFKPAQRDGKPADFPATLRIEFRLADQSNVVGG